MFRNFFYPMLGYYKIWREILGENGEILKENKLFKVNKLFIYFFKPI